MFSLITSTSMSYIEDIYVFNSFLNYINVRAAQIFSGREGRSFHRAGIVKDQTCFLFFQFPFYLVCFVILSSCLHFQICSFFRNQDYGVIHLDQEKLFGSFYISSFCTFLHCAICEQLVAFLILDWVLCPHTGRYGTGLLMQSNA